MSLKVYKASAGSGKTYQLALEYISLALATGQPSAYKQILAVTFTNKATGEMKDRILAYLYDLAYVGGERDFAAQLMERLHIPEKELSRRAAAALLAIVHDYDHFRVETIDSFFQSLLTNLAYELGLARGFRVDLNVEDVVNRAVDRLLLSVGGGARGRGRMDKAVLDFMEEKMADGKGWGVAREMKQFSCKNLFNDVYLSHETALDAFLSDTERVEDFKRALRKAAEQAKAPLLEAARCLAGKARELWEMEEKNKTNVKSAATLAENILAGDFSKEPSATLLKTLGDPTVFLKKDAKGNPAAQAVAADLAECFGKLERLRPGAVRTVNTIELTLKNFMPLTLLNEVGNEVTAINRETDSFMLVRTPDLFNKMVDRADSSFVFERAGTSFRHVMIDEFQDTSRMQWDIFKRLLLENISQGEENMIVGDIKQSIYRWRGGDWEILHRVGGEMARMGGVDERTLGTNFRSREEIVRFNNAFFAHAAARLDELDAEKGLDRTGLVSVIYGDVAQQVKPHGNGGGYVRVALYGKEAAEGAELDSLHDEIKRLHGEKGVPYGEMVILVRRNEDAMAVIDYFAAKYPDEVPLTSDEAFKLSASPAVMLLVGALKYLNEPEEDTVARELCLKMRLRLQEACGTLPEVDPQRLLAGREVLLAIPLYELCQRLIRFFSLPQAEAGGAGQSAYLFSFLDYVLAWLDDHASDLSAFIRYWDDTLSGKAISVEVKDSVYIMTVHKSKGLQRHTVFIPFCNWPLASDRSGNILWCGTENLGQPVNALPIVPVSRQASTKILVSDYKVPYQAEHLNQHIDAINTLYVAFTRAEQNLLVWARDKGKSVKTLIDSFVKDGETEDDVTVREWGSPMPYINKEKETTANPLVIKRAGGEAVRLAAQSAKVHFRQSNEAKDFVADLEEERLAALVAGDTPAQSDKQREYISRGKLLHEVFSHIRTAGDVEKAVSDAARRGLLASEREEHSLCGFIHKRLGNPQAAGWFDGSWKIFPECNILSQDAEGRLVERRPDRVMMRGDETVVVDYKFGNFHERYLDQVRGYMAALRRMGRTRVRGFLWFVYSGEVREVDGE